METMLIETQNDEFEDGYVALTANGPLVRMPPRPTNRFEFASSLAALSWDMRSLPLPSELRSSFNTVPDLRDVRERALAVEPHLRSFGVKELHVFGSVARGDANFDSDIDFAVLMDWGPEYDGDYHDAGVLLARTMRRRVDLAELPFEGALARLASGDLKEVFR